MKFYGFSSLVELNEYGQPILPDAAKGFIKMSINLSSQTAQDNILFKDYNYIGLTFDKDVNDSYVIHYGDKRLKVLYVNSLGRYTQVYMKEM